MTLKEKYTIKNKKRAKQFICIYSILIVFFMVYTSFARYERGSEGYTKVAIANWKIALNDKEITSESNKLTDTLKLVPTTNIYNGNLDKIKPGQEGYFDVKIDPEGTEVSFIYKVILNLEQSSLPEGLSITHYSLNDSDEKTELPANNTVEGIFLLDGKNIFESSDAQKIRYYWNWADSDIEEKSYTVITNVELEQII